jgi:hypothetical protein
MMTVAFVASLLMLWNRPTTAFASCVMGSLGAAIGNAGGRPDQGAGAALGIGGFFATIFFAFVSYIIFALWFLSEGKTRGK